MDCARAIKLLALFAVCGVCGVCGCRQLRPEAKAAAPSSEATNSIPTTDFKQHVRDNCASLLYDLLNDEKDLAKLLIIKRESQELNDLVKNISAAANAGVKKLNQLAATDPTLHLRAPGLPSGEAAVRDAISKTKAGELLRGKGEDFEFKLLLTQAEALNYGTHLARVAGENETRPEPAREFFALSDELKQLYQRVIARLQSHPP